MRSIYRVVIDALAHVSRRGKKIVWLYTSSLVLITLLDGFALIAISKTFNTDNVGSTISSNSQSCAFEGTTLPKPLSGLCTNNFFNTPVSEVILKSDMLYVLNYKKLIENRDVLE